MKNYKYINYEWQHEPITTKLNRLIRAIECIPLLMSNDTFVIKRKNWMTDNDWEKQTQMIQKESIKHMKNILKNDKTLKRRKVKPTTKEKLGSCNSNSRKK